MFETEADMAMTALPFVLDEFDYTKNGIKFIEEPKGLFGIPDLLLFNGHIIAIEFKLRNWKQAIKQAYRYKSFSEESYVLLDRDYVEKAKENIDIFTKFNIGLAAVDENKIEFYYRPKLVKPFSLDLTQKALSLFKEESEVHKFSFMGRVENDKKNMEYKPTEIF